MKKCDLHTHSLYSDGKHSPQELVEFALHANLDALALTDHDTMEGLDALYQAASSTNLKIINGIELSTRWKKHEIHVLGLNLPLGDAQFDSLIMAQKEKRHQRALKIAEKLSALGLNDAYTKAFEIATDGHITRPHFARILVDAGMAKDLQHAFDRFLNRGRPAYVATEWVSMEEATKAIIKNNGTPVLAHPLKYGLTQMKLRALVHDFKTEGGAGLEIVSGLTTNDQIYQLQKICQQFELKASTGSDFHQLNKSKIKVGGQADLPLNCPPIWDDWIL